MAKVPSTGIQKRAQTDEGESSEKERWHQKTRGLPGMRVRDTTNQKRLIKEKSFPMVSFLLQPEGYKVFLSNVIFSLFSCSDSMHSHQIRDSPTQQVFL